MDKSIKSSDTLAAHFGYQPLVTKEAEIIAYRKLYEKNNKILSPKMVDQTCYVGIEVEVENVPMKTLEWPFGWNVTDDGSLRNNGKEFISVPVRGQNIYYLLHGLLTPLQKLKADFSERTSIHVHINVRRLTIEQLVTLLITYIVVERSLYRFIQKAGVDRHRNIFCVPIIEAQHNLRIPYLIYLLKKNMKPELLSTLDNSWRKYSGLNLLPVLNQGTVEFRQLGGTFDIELIMDWINMIQSIRAYAIRTPFDDLKAQIFELNTNSNYVNFLTSIFGNFAHNMIPQLYSSQYKEIEAGIMHVKSAFMLQESYGITLDSYNKSSLKDYLTTHYKIFPRRPLEDIQKEYEMLCTQKLEVAHQAAKVKNTDKIAVDNYKTQMIKLSGQIQTLGEEISERTLFRDLKRPNSNYMLDMYRGGR